VGDFNGTDCRLYWGIITKHAISNPFIYKENRGNEYLLSLYCWILLGERKSKNTSRSWINFPGLFHLTVQCLACININNIRTWGTYFGPSAYQIWRIIMMNLVSLKSKMKHGTTLSFVIIFDFGIEWDYRILFALNLLSFLNMMLAGYVT